MSRGWSGRKVTTARRQWAARLPVPCRRCSLPVLSSQAWHVGHIVDRALGGTDDVGNQWPEHAACNLSAGGKVGAAITNARRPTVTERVESERARGIRGV